jgi:hypothetical protein
MTRVSRIGIAVVLLSALTIVGLVPQADAQVLPPDNPPAEPPPPQEPPPPPPPPVTLRRGSTGGEVLGLQQRLATLGYDPGAQNGTFGKETQFAVFAFQKVQGMGPSGEVTPDVRAALDNPVRPVVLVPELGPDHVEVDLGRQLMTIYRGGSPALITVISSGNNQRYCVKRRCAYAVSPRGTFAIGRKVRGWETSPLGRLYNSAYFYRGFALHGSQSVPLYPASHGCIRVPMHSAGWFQRILPTGLPVYVGG